VAQKAGHQDDFDFCEAIVSPLVRESKADEVALVASFIAI
jgi:hypothetical protein